MSDVDRDRARRNLHTGLVVGLVALAFLVGFVIKMWFS